MDHSINKIEMIAQKTLKEKHDKVTNLEIEKQFVE